MIHPESALTPKAQFKGPISDSERNPVNRKMERRLAILNAGGISAVAGALTTVIARSYTSNWKHAGFFGTAAGIAPMLFVCPRFLYLSCIKSYAKEKEVQKKLLNDVSDAIDEHRPDLHDKLDNYSKAVSKKDA